MIRNSKRHTESEVISYSSVEQMPQAKGSVLFVNDSSKVFKDDIDISPVTLTDGTKYMPWGGDNRLPYNILDMIEKDETLSTCQMFNAEVCYGSGLNYNSANCDASVREEVEDFLLSNSLPSYFLGVCQDFKHFGWCVSVIILDNEGKHIVGLRRKEVCYCRFSPANKEGCIEYVLYGNWNKSIASVKDIEKIPLLSFDNPWGDLQERMKAKNAPRKFAVVCRVPTPDSTYYPIPYYASLFKGKWYNIKQLIALAKEAKLKNSAPLKYHIEVSHVLLPLGQHPGRAQRLPHTRQEVPGRKDNCDVLCRNRNVAVDEDGLLPNAGIAAT